MPHVSQREARAYSMHGVTFTSFASSSTGAASLAAWRADFPPRTAGEQHTMSHEEVLFVLSGHLDVQLDDEHFVAAAGDAVLVPADVTFRVGNSADEPAQIWATTGLGMTASVVGDDVRLAPPWAQ
ncbi:cupin domain-containing protein [Williamsia sterculiae]|uniref:Cupin domain-containing protein n=1 Tax=Williamsia sterculiae TaxID=1344003 RepID=A0A1N7G544_9NOCA|nr:cupin domain-containing protein [Williamsia sterculiae]SIS07685.1 Cupin domain-containing protein [Williamsia sterculiae]